MALAGALALLAASTTVSPTLGQDKSSGLQERRRQEIEVLLRQVGEPPPTGPSSGPTEHDRLEWMFSESGRYQHLADRLDRFLRRYPEDPAHERFSIAKLEATYLAATMRGDDLERLRGEVERILQDRPSPQVRQIAEYWQLRIELARLEGLAAQGQINIADRLKLIEEHVRRYPGAATSVPLVQELIEAEYQRSRRPHAVSWLETLRQHHPHHVTTLTLLEQDRLRSQVGSAWAPSLPTTDGKPVDWRSLQGRVVVVVFWASTHQPSVRFLKRLEAMQPGSGQTGSAVVAISLDTDAAAAKARLRDLGVDWPLICDGLGWHGRLASEYGVRSLPTALLLDHEGRLSHVFTTPDSFDGSGAFDRVFTKISKEPS